MGDVVCDAKGGVKLSKWCLAYAGELDRRADETARMALRQVFGAGGCGPDCAVEPLLMAIRDRCDAARLRSAAAGTGRGRRARTLLKAAVSCGSD